jgi:hypothetical protein
VKTNHLIPDKHRQKHEVRDAWSSSDEMHIKKRKDAIFASPWNVYFMCSSTMRIEPATRTRRSNRRCTSSQSTWMITDTAKKWAYATQGMPATRVRMWIEHAVDATQSPDKHPGTEDTNQI